MDYTFNIITVYAQISFTIIHAPVLPVKYFEMSKNNNPLIEMKNIAMSSGTLTVLLLSRFKLPNILNICYFFIYN